MLHLPLTYSGPHDSSRRYCVQWAGLMLLALAAGSTHAAPPSSTSASPSDVYTLYDCRCALRVRTALSDEPLLAHHNITVSVRDGDTYLWGLLPSRELVEKAVLITRQVPGVRQVHPRLDVVQSGNPLYEFLAEPPRPARPSPRPSRPSAALASLAADIQAMEIPAALAVSVEDHGSNPDVMPATTNEQPVVVLLKPRIFRERCGLEAAVEQLRLRDQRFRGIQPEIDGGIVFLRGNVQSWEHLHELARAVAQLPGVERVILDQIRTLPVTSFR
ncbi:MAG: BON domain-containing protein [Gemmataceae bacterium]